MTDLSGHVLVEQHFDQSIGAPPDEMGIVADQFDRLRENTGYDESVWRAQAAT